MAELAERFRRGEGAYKAAAFNEASTRGQFFNAFLEAFGWDVGNAGLKAPEFATQTRSSGAGGQRKDAKASGGYRFYFAE